MIDNPVAGAQDDVEGLARKIAEDVAPPNTRYAADVSILAAKILPRLRADREARERRIAQLKQMFEQSQRAHIEQLHLERADAHKRVEQAEAALATAREERDWCFDHWKKTGAALQSSAARLTAAEGLLREGIEGPSDDEPMREFTERVRAFLATSPAPQGEPCATCKRVHPSGHSCTPAMDAAQGEPTEKVSEAKNDPAAQGSRSAEWRTHGRANAAAEPPTSRPGDTAGNPGSSAANSRDAGSIPAGITPPTEPQREDV